MLIFLSSGDIERYRQDVLRALALPMGSALQFRYDTKWIGVKTMEEIRGGRLVGQDLIVAYIDQSKPEESVASQHIEVIPVRTGKVSAVAVTGDTVALEFTIGTMAHASDLSAFNAELVSLSERALPKWVEQKPEGKYCAELTSVPSKLDRTNGIGHWQKIVKQLAERDDFKEERAFFTVLGLLSGSERRKIAVELAHADWKQKVAPNSDNDLLVYHFHPKPPRRGAALTLSATVGEGLAIESNTVSVDSRYDLKRIHVRSLDPPTERGSWISVTLADAEDVQLDVEMATKVKSDWLRRVLTGSAIAIGLALAQVVAVSVSDNDGDVKAWLIVFAMLGSLIVGMAAAFGLRRSF